MLKVIDLGTEESYHIDRVEKKLFAEFTTRTNDYIASEASKQGYLPREYMKQHGEWLNIFCHLVNMQYLDKMQDAITLSMRMFERSDIKFRLHDVDSIIHDWHRIICLWRVNGAEYAFDFMWDSTVDDPFDSLYKISKINSSGDVVNGDLLHDTRQFFHDGADLPPWFVDGLRSNS